MIHPHNPVMQRLEEMARLWREKVKPQHRLIRWQLQSEDSRMFEGFCRLESSPHGFLDNLFVFFYTPFESAETYSHALMEHWLKEYDENTEQQQTLAAAGVKGNWERGKFRQAVLTQRYEACDAMLPDMIRSYREWLSPALGSGPSPGPGTATAPEEWDFVLALLPREMASPAGFNIWLQDWVKRDLPPRVQVLVFDHVDGNSWGETFGRYEDQSCTLEHDLRMQEAIREIATAGEATDPYAAFRRCMFEMGDAATKKDLNRLHEWGAKALDIGKKSGDPNLLATGYISYAGILFGFEEAEKIETLLNDGMRLCRKEIGQDNESMKALLLQFYAYKGAHCQIRRQRKEALGWFMTMGEEAERFTLFTQAISAYYKAFLFSDDKGFEEEKRKAVVAAISLTEKISPEESQVSEYPFLALAALSLEIPELKLTAVQRMQAIYGPDWEEIVEKMQEHYTKSKLKKIEQEAQMQE